MIEGKILIKSLFLIGWFKFCFKLILLNIDDHFKTSYLQRLFQWYKNVIHSIQKQKKKSNSNNDSINIIKRTN